MSATAEKVSREHDKLCQYLDTALMKRPNVVCLTPDNYMVSKLHRKDDFAEVSKNLVRYRFEYFCWTIKMIM